MFKIIILLRITAIKKIMLAKAESFKKEFGVTCVYTGARLFKKAPRKTNARRNANTLKKIVRSYVSESTGTRYLKKYIRETRMPVVTRIRLKKLYGVPYREVRRYDI